MFVIGSVTIPQRISPPIIYLQIPQKLVLEVSGSGSYGFIVWSRNGESLGTSNSQTQLSEFVNFFEIFVREPTTNTDYGIYNVSYSGSGGSGTEISVFPASKPIISFVL